MRIAMWSGPRNLSTALMYAFANRSDCAVWDEPFYAAYLSHTGLNHPMRAEILAAGEQNADAISARCIGDAPDNKPVFYQKHMTQHMIPGFSRSWIAELTNVFLIRHPARVIASYAAKRENPTLDDIGFRQQAELFDETCQRTGKPAIVVDSFDIRQNPEKTLTTLCNQIGLAFDPAMLRWPKGGHRSDGVWAPHWYGAVQASGGFSSAEGPLPDLPETLLPVLEAALPYYEKMAAHSI